jgi:hypothetical protein
MPVKSWKNHPQKKNSNWFFPLLPWAVQTAPTEEYMFQNVAYRPNVYKTGVAAPTLNEYKFILRGVAC